MRSPIFLGMGAALLIGLGALGWFLLPNAPSEVATTTPHATLVPRDSGATVVLTAKDGKVITVPDFTYTHPSVEVIDTGITYIYLTQNDELKELDPRYGIVYGSDSSFVVGLLAAPLGAARAAAEAKLKEFVPLPETILCTLDIEVRAAATIDARYAGRELGLSFCPGHVPLP